MLGKLIVFSPGGMIVKRKTVTFVNTEKLVVYSLEIHKCSSKDKVGWGKQIWVLTNKIPDDYTVKFDVVGE